MLHVQYYILEVNCQERNKDKGVHTEIQTTS